MLGRKRLLIVASLGALPTAILAQAPAARPDAATIVEAITDLGYLGGWGNYADFDGCPQDDAVGREVLTLLEQGQPSPSVQSALVHFWADDFAGCDYAPLNAWVLTTITALADGESWELTTALAGLKGAVDADASDQFLALALDPSRPGWIRTQLADFTFPNMTTGDRLGAFVALLSAPPMPSDWIETWSADLLDTSGSDFVNAVVAAESSMDDNTLRPVMGIVLSAISAGSYSSTEPAFRDLVEVFDSRPELFDAAEAVRVTIVSGYYRTTRVLIEDLVQTQAMDQQHQTGLLAALEQSWNAFKVDRPSAGPLLSAVRSQVEGLVSGGQLNAGDADQLLDAIDGAIQGLDL